MRPETFPPCVAEARFVLGRDDAESMTLAEKIECASNLLGRDYSGPVEIADVNHRREGVSRQKERREGAFTGKRPLVISSSMQPTRSELQSF